MPALLAAFGRDLSLYRHGLEHNGFGIFAVNRGRLLFWRLRHETLGWLGAGKPIVHRREIVVKVLGIGVLAELVRALSALLRLRGRDDPEVVLGVLQIVFRHHRVTRGLGIARQLQILFRDMGGIATHFHIRAVALEVPAQRIHVLAPAIVVPAAGAVLVVLLVWSHRFRQYLGKEHKRLWAIGTLTFKAAGAPMGQRERSQSFLPKAVRLNHLGLIKTDRVLVRLPCYQMQHRDERVAVTFGATSAPLTA